MIRSGRLVPAFYYSLDGLDPNLMPLQEDITKQQLSKTKRDQNDSNVDAVHVIEMAVKEWKRLCSGRRTLCFASSIDHSKRLCAAFRSVHVRAAHLDGELNMTRRQRILSGFHEGSIDVLCSMNILTEGSSFPVSLQSLVRTS